MGKPKAPAAPDYAGAATAQGAANVDSAIASNFLNQVNQVGPDGSLTYSYDQSKGYTDPTTGKFIPSATATTTLSPEQQKLYDQNTAISQALNDIAQKGIGYVGQAAGQPVDLSKLPGLQTSQTAQNHVTDALMQRLQPQIDRSDAATNARLANQGINLGSDAYKTAQTIQGQNDNDLKTQAALSGYQNGLASGQFDNQARAQALQEQDYATNQPLNMLNALRTGNQVTIPQFGNVSGNAQIGAAPVYAATSDAANFANQQYQSQNSLYGSMLSGLGNLGGAAITKYSDRRLKENVRKLFELANGLGWYAFNYIGDYIEQMGYMADEVEQVFPAAVSMGPTGYSMVHYGKVR